MAQRIINIGSSANKGDGDPIRTAFGKVNDNFTELYGKVTVLEDGTVAQVQDTKGSIFADDSTLLVDAINGLIPASVVSGTLNNNTVGTHTGPVDGDLVGSVFADNSTLLVDGVNGTIPASVVSGTITNTIDTNTIATSSGNLTITADNYVRVDSDNNGQIEIGRNSGVGNVILGNKDNNTAIELDGDVILGRTNTASDFYGEIEFNSGTTLFQAGNSVTFNCDVTGAGFTYNQPAIPGDPSEFGFDADTIDFGTGNTIDMQNCSLLLNGTTFTDEPWISLADLKTEVAASVDFTDFQTRIAAL